MSKQSKTAGKTAEAAHCAEGKKYELTEETKTLSDGTVVHRIRALKDFSVQHSCSPERIEIHNGDLGGWVESEENLSQDGSCWVSDEAEVYGNARVKDNARVMSYAIVRGSAEICENAFVSGLATVEGQACVKGSGYTYIGDFVTIGDMTVVGGGIGSITRIVGHAVVGGRAEIVNADIYGDAHICERAFVGTPFNVPSNVRTGGRVAIGTRRIDSYERITSVSDFVSIRNFWSSGRLITYIPQTGVWSVGCFNGTGEMLINKAYKDGKLKGKCYKLTVRYVEKILKLLAKNGGVA